MNEYRIEKVRRPVTLVLRGGTSIGGDVFLQPTARYRPGPQEPDDLFNEAEPFVPLATADDQLVLVAKDHVTMVHYVPAAADTSASGVAGALVDLVFADGATCSGELRIEMRASRARLLDFLNEEHQRFLTMYTPVGVCLVNFRQIAQARQRR